MIDRYLGAYDAALAQGLPAGPTAAQAKARLHDWWDRPMAFTEMPPRSPNLPGAR
jgi:hypothetical protein